MVCNIPAAKQSWHQSLRVRLALLSGLLLIGMATTHANPTEAFQICPGLADDRERLACFDRYVQDGPEAVMIDEEAVPLEDLIDEDGTLFGFGIDGLTNHERNKLVARADDNDSSRLYMDAELSVKYPVLSPVVDVMSSLLNIDRSRNLPRLYLAFSTRFSQYIGSRDSAPVIARHYNPEIFLRVWRDGHYGRTDPSYWDFGYGHESNGQQIENEALFNQVEQYYVSQNQPGKFARDAISRGWDYVSLDWNKQWNTGLIPNLGGQTETEIEYRHYLEDGLFQGNPEEYNVWERDGSDNKTRDYYSGVSLAVQYDFVNGVCPTFFCFERVRLTHETGHAKPFAHNTTSLEFTTNIAGLPINIWGRAGYDSDLVDYYDYTNSWGLGIEFLR